MKMKNIRTLYIVEIKGGRTQNREEINWFKDNSGHSSVYHQYFLVQKLQFTKM